MPLHTSDPTMLRVLDHLGVRALERVTDVYWGTRPSAPGTVEFSWAGIGDPVLPTPRQDLTPLRQQLGGFADRTWAVTVTLRWEEFERVRHAESDPGA